ncbi:MAG: ATP-binding protein [Chloroflexota bacterium]
MSRKRIDLNRLKQNLERIEVSSQSYGLIAKSPQPRFDQAYHLSAAVLTAFEPAQLKPFGLPQDAEPPSLDPLLADCTLRYDEQNRPYWMLKHSARTQALTQLQTRERLLDALALTEPRPDDRLQMIFEAYINGFAEPLEQQTLTDLRYTLQIREWLSGTELADQLPTLVDVRTRITWEELMQPFRYLVTDGFQGREAELAQLENHLVGDGDQVPLLVYGPGGVGKSTLMAEFILRQFDGRSSDDRASFTYIDFDQANIDPHEPLTILTEAVRQLASQHPALTGRDSEIVEEWTYELAAGSTRGAQTIFTEQKAVRNDYTGNVQVEGDGVIRNIQVEGDGVIGNIQVGDDSVESVIAGNTRIENVRARGSIVNLRPHINALGSLLQQAQVSDRPWLLVLDTFEEVQLRSRDAVSVIGSFLADLRDGIPQARIILAGRGEVFGLPVTSLQLGEFDEAAALAYLKAQQIQVESVARAIVQAIGGNPLSLKLAARVVVQEELQEDDAEPDALRELLRKVSEGNIQGQLYRRVLDHVSDEEVRRLAHPGLTLRRITPELIEKVLAGPCQINIQSTDDAQRLFDRLSREVSLVTPAGPNELRHRSDVRAVMITALHSDQPLVVHDIHKAAIAYYAARDDVESRAEEIYHRLFIETNLEEIDARWVPQWREQLDQSLRPALYELPPRVRAWLATKLQLTGIEGVDWNEAELTEWEGYAEKRVEDLVRSNSWDEALKILSERTERSIGSPLYLLETQILRQQTRWEEARRVAYDGIYSLKQAEDNIGLLDLLRQAIEIDLELKYVEQAELGLAQARELLAAQPQFNELVALQLNVFALKLTRQQQQASTDEIEAQRQLILEQFLSLSDQELLTHPLLIRDVLAEFASTHNQVLRRGLSLMLLGNPTPEQRAQLADSMQLWDQAISQTLEEAPGLLLRTISKSGPVNFDGGWQRYMQETPARVLNRDISSLLARYGEIQSTVEIEADDGDISFSVGDRGVAAVGSNIYETISTDNEF